MKITILNGSPRKSGLTAAILHGIEIELKSKGAEIEFIDLIDKNISHCMGCCSCYKTGRCHIKDDADDLSELIRNSDGVVIGSPTYASNVSGVLKDFIDRGHFVIEQALYGKYCVTVATGENYGSRDTSRVLNNLMLYSGGVISSKIVLNAPFNDPLSVADKIYDISTRAGAKLYRDIQRRSLRPIQRLRHKVVFEFGIRPFVKRKGAAYAGVLQRWEESHLLRSRLTDSNTRSNVPGPASR